MLQNLTFHPGYQEVNHIHQMIHEFEGFGKNFIFLISTDCHNSWMDRGTDGQMDGSTDEQDVNTQHI